MISDKEKALLRRISELEADLKKIKKQKKYGLVWEDKPEQIVEDCRHDIPVLRLKEKKKEIDPILISDKTKDNNILIEGDNYHALSVLNYTHKGKVDVIYIDPPYNTGKANEWKYNDKYVDENDSYRHSKWISFLEKRLVLSKELLNKTGVIFISIDNNEQSTLKLLCDGIFGEENFVGMLIWRKKEGGGQSDAYFVTEHEYVLVYSKTSNFKWLDEKIPVEEAQFNKQDENGKFTAVKLAKWGNTARREDRPKMYFSIKSPNGKNIYPIAPDGGDGRWRVGKKRMDMLVEKNLIFWQEKKGAFIPYEKVYFDGEEVKKIKERSILYDLANTADGTNELTDIFNKKDVFENPKPTDLIKFFLKYGANDNALVLDFFAGSGTTGHAVLSLNNEDDGNRKFILCTNNENNICEEIAYERIKKVINGYKNKKGEKIQGFGGNLRYYKTDLINIERLHNTPDNAKIKLTYQAGEMIALRENTLNEVEKNEWWQIFEGFGKNTAIYFKEDKEKLNALVEKMEKTKQPCALYIFSWGKNEYKSEYSSNNVRIEDIPEPILEVYKEINRL